MADLTIAIKAIDAASAELAKVKRELQGMGDTAATTQTRTQGLGDRTKAALGGLAAVGVAAAGGFYALARGVGEAINASNRQQNALLGLSSVARAFGASQDAANAAARRLASDGLMSVADAATGLKNLLAAGFSLPQAITLMERFKDSAAFARQGSLSFGEAIRGATEGIKNGNSILVDNAGVTKNLSILLEEAGYSAQDLMKASTDAGVRMAIFNGIIRETNPQLGDAARLSQTFSGAMSRMNTEVEKVKVAIGDALKPALTQVLAFLTPVITAIRDWIMANPQLTALIIGTVAAILLLTAAVGAIAAVFLIFAAAGAAVVGIIAAVLAGLALLVVGVILAIKYWKQIKEAILNALQPVMPVINALGKVIGTLVGYIKDAWAWAGNQLVKAFKDLWNAIQPLMPVLKVIGAALLAFGLIVMAGPWIALMAIIAVVGLVVGALARFVSFLISILVPVITFIWTVISTAFNIIVTVITTALNVIMAIWNAVWPVLSAVIQVVWGIIRIVIAAAILAVLAIIYAVLLTIKTIWQAVWGVFGPIVMAVWNAIKPIVQGGINFVMNVISAGVNAARAIWNGISALIGIAANAISGVYNTVAGWFNRIIGFISGMVGAAANAGRAVFNALKDAIMSVGDSIIGAVKGIIQKIRDLLPGSDAKTGPLSDLMASGRAFPETWAKGLASSAGVMRSAAESAVTGIDLPGLTANVAVGSRAAAGFGAGSPQEGTVHNEFHGNITLADEAAVDRFFERLNRDSEKARLGAPI